jgi:hypothetical protein
MDESDLPDEVRRLFWDVEPGSLDRDRHADYVMERIMTRGGWAAMQWLRSAYSIADLRAFLERKGGRLAPRDLAYWCLWTGLDRPCGPGGGRPAWAGP